MDVRTHSQRNMASSNRVGEATDESRGVMAWSRSDAMGNLCFTVFLILPSLGECCAIIKFARKNKTQNSYYLLFKILGPHCMDGQWRISNDVR